MKTYVLYHGYCADGFGGAWAAWRALGNTAEYVPVQYGDPAPELPDGARVYLVDFSYKREATLALAARTSLTILDHHKTAEGELAGLDFATFDMNKSGAMLAWEHFHPRRPAPLLIEYVQDRDIWRWALPDSREVSAALWSYPMEFSVWTTFAERLENRTLSVVNEGAAILRYMQQQTEMICSQARQQQLGEHTVPVVNATSLWSEVGEELIRRFPEAPFAAAYYENAHGLRKWSLRSRGEFDVSAVAKQFGGGGHRNAAGFEEPLA
jgi:hypothetical protein